MVNEREGGQATVVLLALVAGLLAACAIVFHVAVAADLAARAQSSADAGALAGGTKMAEDLQSSLTEHAGDAVPAVDDTALRLAAEDYAKRNGATLVAFERRGLTIIVTVQSGEPGESSGWLNLPALRAEAVAMATVTPHYTLGPPHEAPELRRKGLALLAERAGAALRADSALLRYGGDCRTGVDVVHLSTPMKIAILRLEHAMGASLSLTSAYRSAACQARLFATVPGPVAPPGRSLHNYGAAIDVQNPSVVARYAAGAGLCQPLPATDAVHFSLASAPECAGRAGPLGPGGAYAGEAGSFVTYDVRLVSPSAEDRR